MHPTLPARPAFRRLARHERVRAKNMFTPSLPPTPAVTPPPPMPDPMNPDAIAAAQKAAMAAATQGGRSSTVLTRAAGGRGQGTGAAGTVAGAAYSQQRLSGA
jgi:hypothetical protein